MLKIKRKTFKNAIIKNKYIFTSLQSSIPDPLNMSEFLMKKKESERHFLDQLLDGSKLDKFSIPVPIKCELRKYQQVCVFFFP